MLKENAGQKTQLIHRELKLLITENFQSHFKVTLRIRTIKPTWWNTFSKKWRELLPYVLTSCQTICLANLDGATDRVTSQSSERTDATTKKLTQNHLRLSSSFVIRNISSYVWTGSSLFRQTLMWRWYLYIKVSLTSHS